MGFLDEVKDAIGIDSPEEEAAEAKKKAAPKPAEKKHAAPKKRTYTVKKGDTLSEIGERFGVDHHDIAKLNHVKNPDLIYPGQVFTIPD
jgi:nucleoid-associated protein YgaU